MSCPVCFGGDDPVVRESLNAGIGVLMGVTGVVLGLFARFFVSLARRSKAAAHLVGVPAVPRMKRDQTGEAGFSGSPAPGHERVLDR